MLIPASRILDREENQVYATLAVALSVFVFAYSIIFGAIAVLAFYAVWLPLIIVAPGLLITGFLRVFPLLVLPAVAALSTLWSDASAVTLRSSIQYGTTIICGLAAARLVTPNTMARGGLLGSFAVLGYSFLYGTYQYDVVDGSYSFSGAFGSKNQLGLYASLALIFALATVIVFENRTRWKLFALGVGGMALTALVLSDSATSILTIGGALFAALFTRTVAIVPPQLRRAIIGIGLLLFLASIRIAYELDVFKNVLEIFGKDATLTGRTFLWREGIQMGHENPIFGLGYYAFWIHDRPQAEELWEIFYINSRSGFHFHNTIIEAYVGLGLIGVALLGALTLALVLRSMTTMMSRTHTPEAIFMVTLALLFAARSIVEIDYFTPYTVGSFFVPYLLLTMADMRKGEMLQLRARVMQTRRSRRQESAARSPVSPYWMISE